MRLVLALSLLLLVLSCQVEVKTSKEEAEKSPKLTQKQKKPKIVAFGDSITAGFGLSERESYPYLLQQKLDAEGYNYEVINAGLSGDTTRGGLERIDWSLEDESVEILIVALGGNDLLRAVPPSQVKSNLAEIIRKAKSKGIKVLLCGMLAPPAMGQEYQREFNRLFPDLADEHKTAYMPFLLEGVALNKELNQPDGIHPNAEGMKIIAENIYQHLKPLLKK